MKLNNSMSVIFNDNTNVYLKNNQWAILDIISFDYFLDLKTNIDYSEINFKYNSIFFKEAFST